MVIKRIISTVILTCLLAVVASAATPTDSTFLKSFDGTKIYYEVSGKGKPIILVHGFTNNGMTWKGMQLYKDLQEAGYQLIILDMRGNGRSDKPHTEEAYLHDAEAKDIMLLADQLKLKSYSVIGYSRGSIITSRLLVLDKRVNAAVIGGMGSDFINPEWPRRIMFYHALNGEDVPELAAMVKRVQDQKLDQRALALMQYGQPSTSKEELAMIKKPVLVICGDQDEDNGSSKELASLIPGSDYVRVPGNHGGASRTPEFSKAVVAFLRKAK